MDFRNSRALQFIAGPCAIESRQFALETAEELRGIFSAADIPFFYKSSFDKANRSSAAGFRGVGIDKGLEILAEVKSKFGIRVLTDVHEIEHVKPVAEVVDMLQTPAFLCRQTDFIEAVAMGGKPVNFKKGQFLSPAEMQNVISKAVAAAKEFGVAHDHFTACERGFSFGYGNLVVDMRGFRIMAETCRVPIVFDATHSVQMPGSAGTSTGGDRSHVPSLARAALATGYVSGIFMETHPNPDQAPCDGPNMVPFKDLPTLLPQLKAIHGLVRAVSAPRP
jgi:2-dehydro-3-deoxyphosphooctonate aldolase (KDO 8-P synthase)